MTELLSITIGNITSQLSRIALRYTNCNSKNCQDIIIILWKVTLKCKKFYSADFKEILILFQNFTFLKYSILHNQFYKFNVIFNIRLLEFNIRKMH